MVTMTSADKALKTLYLGVVTEQINTNANPLLARIKQSTEDVWGQRDKKTCAVRRKRRYRRGHGNGQSSGRGWQQLRTVHAVAQKPVRHHRTIR